MARVTGSVKADKATTKKAKPAVQEHDGHPFLFSEDGKNTRVLASMTAGRGCVAIMLSEYKGRKKLDIRSFFYDADAEGWRPTGAGVGFTKADHVDTLFATLEEHHKEIATYLGQA